MLERIYIESEDGGEGFSGYGDTEHGERVFLSDDESLLKLMRKLKSFALEHSVRFIEIPVTEIPDE